MLGNWAIALFYYTQYIRFDGHRTSAPYYVASPVRFLLDVLTYMALQLAMHSLYIEAGAIT